MTRLLHSSITRGEEMFLDGKRCEENPIDVNNRKNAHNEAQKHLLTCSDSVHEYSSMHF